LSRVISRASSSGVESWALQPVDGDHLKNLSAITARQIEQVQQQAYQEGFDQGRTDGFALSAQRLESILAALAEPLGKLDETIMDELAALIIACTRQLIRRELRTNPGEIIGIVREALGVLPVSARKIRVLLHPEDAVLVRENLGSHSAERRWSIEEDASITRGGCRVVTENSQIDASIESRLAAVAARMLGNERQGNG
jgi:flagellar assembly protein FliH